MIKRRVQVITQPYKERIHRGVDLRSVSFASWKLQDIILPEECLLVRFGVDGYGNDYLVFKTRQFDVADELKFIHVKYSPNVSRGEIMEKGAVIGKTAIRSDYNPPRSNSNAHHLHFETWRDRKPFDPVIYFEALKIKYKYK